MPVLQSTGPVSQITASQNPTGSGKKVLPTTSVTGAAAHQDLDSDFDHHTDTTSPVCPMEE